MASNLILLCSLQFCYPQRCCKDRIERLHYKPSVIVSSVRCQSVKSNNNETCRHKITEPDVANDEKNCAFCIGTADISSERKREQEKPLSCLVNVLPSTEEALWVFFVNQSNPVLLNLSVSSHFLSKPIQWWNVAYNLSSLDLPRQNFKWQSVLIRTTAVSKLWRSTTFKSVAFPTNVNRLESAF